LDEMVIVDARGLLCPMPVIRVQEAIACLPAGSRLQLVATDPGVHADVPAWCRVHGHAIIAVANNDDVADTIRMWIRVGGPCDDAPK